MPKLINITNHRLTSEQVHDANKSLNVTTIIEMPKYLKDKWGAIPTDINAVSLDEFLTPFKNYIDDISEKNDYLFIMGESGATFNLCLYAHKKGRIAIHSTTRRENKNDLTIYSHIRFREYFNKINKREL